MAPSLEERLQQLKQVSGMSDAAVVPHPAMPDFLKQARAAMGVGSGTGNFNGLGAGLGSSGGGTGSTPKGDFGKFLRAIAQQESGGNYGDVNSSSGALGKYQIMPGNIPSWSREILGHSITAQQFLHSRALQEKIAQGKLGKYYRQYGAQGAASAWYSGSPTKWKTSTGTQAGGYPSVRAYVNQIMKRMWSY